MVEYQDAAHEEDVVQPRVTQRVAIMVLASPYHEPLKKGMQVTSELETSVRTIYIEISCTCRKIEANFIKWWS